MLIHGRWLWFTACIASCCCGCTQLAFFTANARASYGHYSRLTNLAYGADARNKLDVYIPDQLREPRQPVPIVVFFHGGGWNSGNKSYYKFVGAALAEQGYLAVLPNYRLYPQVKSKVIFADPARAVAWVRAHASEWGGDVDELYLAGHSAGAHFAVMLALDPEYLQQAGALPEDLRGVIGLAGPYDFLPFTRDYMNDLFGPAEQLAASQPINFVRPDAPPLLLLQGLQDSTVEPKNTRNLQAALQAIGGRVQAQYFENADHGDLVAAFSSLARHRAPVLQQIGSFIDETRRTNQASSTATHSGPLSD